MSDLSKREHIMLEVLKQLIQPLDPEGDFTPADIEFDIALHTVVASKYANALIELDKEGIDDE